MIMAKLKRTLLKILLLYAIGALAIWISFLGQMPSDTTTLVLLVIFGPPALLLAELLIEKLRHKTPKIE